MPPLLDIPAALELISTSAHALAEETVPLHEALGRVTSQAILSSEPAPLFDKALMDGYAIRAEDLAQSAGLSTSTPSPSLRVTGLICAGQTPSISLTAGEAIQIMTGAPLPSGTTAVVKIEATTRKEDLVFIHESVPVGANLIRRGAVMQPGQLVLSAGQRLAPQHLAGLAELGIVTIPVKQQPTLAILATGDELVPPSEKPGPGQIRNSNETLLASLARQAGCDVQRLGIASDSLDELTLKIRQGLTADLLLLTGGVSAGMLDLVPQALAAEGVEKIFHKVDIKPGKPIWFGIKRQPKTCLVFGLPGNPVSSLVCFELFVKTALRKLSGINPTIAPAIEALAAVDEQYMSDRPTYHPAVIDSTDSSITARTISWQGSSDLQATLSANGMIYFPANSPPPQQGDTLLAYRWC